MFRLFKELSVGVSLSAAEKSYSMHDDTLSWAVA